MRVLIDPPSDYAGKLFVFPGDIAVEVYTDQQRKPAAAFTQL